MSPIKKRTAPKGALKALFSQIQGCDRCPRLRDHCEQIARERKRAYRDQEYWGKPITGFGDPDARLIIVGLAPAAHGANRTGRIFTGDRSGDWLYRALHKAGFANQPTSLHRQDGLELHDAYVTCVGKCAPPDNKPLPAELEACAPYLERELELLTRARVFLALGQIVLHGLWPFIAPRKPSGEAIKRPAFGHGAHLELPDGKQLILSYHPSQRNTFTGRLTEPMFDEIFSMARRSIERTLG